MCVPISPQKLWQQIQPRRLRRPQAHAPNGTARDTPHSLLRAVHCGENAARVVEQQIASDCQRHAATITIEQSSANLLFELSNLMRHRRLREVATLGRASKVAQIGDGNEGLNRIISFDDFHSDALSSARATHLPR